MSETKHEPGTFCWVELVTSDPGAAKSFYGELMGWSTHDDPIPGGGTYTMIKTGEKNVGGLYAINEQMKQQGVPPNWMPYVSVADARRTVERARQLGGEAVMDAFDVMDIGTMAVLKDPTGAHVSIWQPKIHHGTDCTGAETGSVCWNELATNDTKKAGEFYSGLFGWNPTVQDFGGQPYTLMMHGEKPAGGMFAMDPQMAAGVPPHWMIYFAVPDCDAGVEKAKSLGAELVHGPMDVPTVGRLALLKDPQGAMFSIIKLEPQAS